MKRLLLIFLFLGVAHAQSINLDKGLGGIQLGKPYPVGVEAPDLMNQYYSVPPHSARFLRTSHGVAPELAGVADTLAEVTTGVWDGKVCTIIYEGVCHDAGRLIRGLTRRYGKPERTFDRITKQSLYRWRSKRTASIVAVGFTAFPFDKSMGQLNLSVAKQPETKEMLYLLGAQKAMLEDERH